MTKKPPTRISPVVSLKTTDMGSVLRIGTFLKLRVHDEIDANGNRSTFLRLFDERDRETALATETEIFHDLVTSVEADNVTA